MPGRCLSTWPPSCHNPLQDLLHLQNRRDFFKRSSFPFIAGGEETLLFYLSVVHLQPKESQLEFSQQRHWAELLVLSSCPESKFFLLISLEQRVQRLVQRVNSFAGLMIIRLWSIYAVWIFCSAQLGGERNMKQRIPINSITSILILKSMYASGSTGPFFADH